MPGAERVLALAEVEVYGPNAKTSLQGEAAQSSTANGALASRAVDGNVNGNYFAGSVSHTMTELDPWWQLDLGESHPIARVVIRNRTDCCMDRINPAVVSAFDANYELIWSTQIATTQAEYAIDVSPPEVPPTGRNLLRNSSFVQQTNPPLPDYWDLFHSAALQLPDVHERYGVTDEQPPIDGVRALRVANSRDDFSFMHVISTRSKARLAPGPYTFSVFAKSAVSGKTLRVYRSWSDESPSVHELTSRWTRISVTFNVSPSDGILQPIVNFPRAGLYHMAAPKLELGTRATPYVTDAGRVFIPAAKGVSRERSSRTPRVLGFERASTLRRSVITREGGAFFIIGMAVGPWGIPADWYFSDLREHGINTVFYLGAKDDRDAGDVRKFAAAAERNGLKVIVGVPLAGQKPPDWRDRIQRYAALVNAVKAERAIIGWYPLDEPSRSSWSETEIVEVYRTVKQIDPQRLVLVNWAYDAIPNRPIDVPATTPDSSDIYSVDYYPFTIHGLSLRGFDSTMTRALEIAGLIGRPSHAWIQLYGSNDAWREPNGDELSYMVYRNLLYGGMYSYWDTKSNSAVTWERVRKINAEAQSLVDRLFAHDDARQVIAPTAANSVAYSAWRRGTDIYLIVLNEQRERVRIRVDIPAELPLPPAGESIFSGEAVRVVAPNALEDTFDALQGKVYLFVSPQPSRASP